LSIGWSQVVPAIEIISQGLYYGELMNQTFVIKDSEDGHPLANTGLAISINEEQYLVETDNFGLVTLSFTEIPGQHTITVEVFMSLLVDQMVQDFDVVINSGIINFDSHLVSNNTSIPPSVMIDLIDPLYDLDSNLNYSVTILRDGKITQDTMWQFVDNKIKIYPVYPSLNALSTVTNHNSHLYPGSYTVEIYRHHPFYITTSALVSFNISPLEVDFDFTTNVVNNSVYLHVEYDLSEGVTIEPEYIVTLYHSESENILLFDTTNMIEIPWEKGSLIITVEGYGYSSGIKSKSIQLDDFNTSGNISSFNNTNSTSIPSNNGFGVSINSIQVIGLTVLGGSAMLPLVQQIIRKRK
jgi:hypothetical protein